MGEGVPVTQGQDARKEIKNRKTKQQFEREGKITLGCESNSEHSTVSRRSVVTGRSNDPS